MYHIAVIIATSYHAILQPEWTASIQYFVDYYMTQCMKILPASNRLGDEDRDREAGWS